MCIVYIYNNKRLHISLYICGDMVCCLVRCNWKKRHTHTHTHTHTHPGLSFDKWAMYAGICVGFSLSYVRDSLRYMWDVVCVRCET